MIEFIASIFITGEKLRMKVARKRKRRFMQGMFHLPCSNQIHDIQITNKLHFTLYDVLQSQFSHQHVSAAIPPIFSVLLLLLLFEFLTSQLSAGKHSPILGFNDQQE
jgi:hypothetical protein